MQSSKQLSALDTKEGPRRSSLERGERLTKEKIGSDKLNRLQMSEPGDVSSRPSSGREKRKRTLSSFGHALQPLPNIETIMSYQSLTRPTYNSILNGEPPAQVYSTVIHTPKPPGLRPRPPLTISALDQMLARAEELRAGSGSVKQSRLRNELSDEEALMNQDMSSRAMSAGHDGALDLHLLAPPRPTSPAESTSSTAMATVASSPPSSPPSSPFPSTATTPTFRPQDLEPSDPPPSPTPSFRSSRSTLSSIYDSYSSAHSSSTTSSRSSLSIPPSPSPGTSRTNSPHRLSTAEDWQLYSSPSTSPSLSATTPRRPKFASPDFALFPPDHTSSSPRASDGIGPTQLHASTLAPLPPFDALPATLFEDEGKGDDFEWSLNGGGVVFGAAGVAVSPRMLSRRCGCCESCEGKGLGLYVIDEVGEE